MSLSYIKKKENMFFFLLKGENLNATGQGTGNLRHTI